MDEATELLGRVADGDPQASAALLEAVYADLRRLAAARMAREAPGATLQATALVHEAYLRLLGDGAVKWEGRRHFFGAAAEAMRRILVEQARRRRAAKRGGGRQEVDAASIDIAAPEPAEDVEAVHEALERLATEKPEHAELVKLRYFAGLSMPELAETLGISLATAERRWTFARAWLLHALAPPAET